MSIHVVLTDEFPDDLLDLTALGREHPKKRGGGSTAVSCEDPTSGPQKRHLCSCAADILIAFCRANESSLRTLLPPPF